MPRSPPFHISRGSPLRLGRFWPVSYVNKSCCKERLLHYIPQSRGPLWAAENTQGQLRNPMTTTDLPVKSPALPRGEEKSPVRAAVISRVERSDVLCGHQRG